MKKQDFEWGEDAYTVDPWPYDGMRFIEPSNGADLIKPTVLKLKVLKVGDTEAVCVVEGRSRSGQFVRSQIFRERSEAVHAARDALDQVMDAGHAFAEELEKLA